MIIRYLLNLLFLLSVGGTIAFAQSPPPALANDYFPAKWNEFVSVENKFKARFPRQPQFVTVVDGASGAILGREYHDGAEDFITYQIRIIELPAEKKTLAAENPQQAFTEIKNDELVKFGTDAKVVVEKPATRGDCAANTLEYDVADNLRYRVLYVFCNDKLYRAAVRTFRNHGEETLGAENAYGKIADAFLQSFAPLTGSEVKQLKSTGIKTTGKFFDQFLRFGIAFPSAPEITREISGDKSRYDYAAEAGKLIYSVEAKIVSDEFSFSNNYRETLYDSWRDSFTEGSKAKILADKKVELGGIAARDLTIQFPPTNAKFNYRLIAVDGKFYVLWVLDAMLEKSVEREKTTLAATQKFFASFEKLSEFAPPKYVGIVMDNIYSTDFYGFSINLPENWTISGGQILQAFAGENNTDVTFDMPEHTETNPDFLVATKVDELTKKNNTLQITGSFYGGLPTDYRELIKQTTKGLLEDGQTKLITAYRPVKIGGKSIWEAEFETTLDSVTKVKFKNYLLFHKDFLIIINGFYLDETEKIAIENAVKTLKFFRGK